MEILMMAASSRNITFRKHFLILKISKQFIVGSGLVGGVESGEGWPEFLFALLVLSPLLQILEYYK